MHDQNCFTCFKSVRPVLFSFASVQQAAFVQRLFLETLNNTAACSTVNLEPTRFIETLLSVSQSEKCLDMIDGRNSMDSGVSNGAMCQIQEYKCFVDSNCSGCLLDLYSNQAHSVNVLKSASCANLNASFAETIAHWCPAFPACSWTKLRCNQSDTCASCWKDLQAGDGVTASRQCPESHLIVNSDAYTMDLLVARCMPQTQTGCDFFLDRCSEAPYCMACLDAIHELGGRGGASGIIRGMSTPSCTSATNISGYQLANVVNNCPRYSTCQRWTALCIFMHPSCLLCLNGSAGQDDVHCAELLSDTAYAVDSSCAPCSRDVKTINIIVMVTSAVGSASVVACMMVVVVILAQGANTESIRDRLIIGMMSANAIYSLANAFPINGLVDSDSECGHFAFSFTLIQIGRALWFGGKYSLVGFEISVLAASTLVLRGRSRGVSVLVEVAMFIGSAMLGACAFAFFYIQAGRIQANGLNDTTQAEATSGAQNHAHSMDDLDDDEAGSNAALRFASAQSEYDHVLQSMLQMWLGFLGLAIVMWIALRLTLRAKLSKWRVILAERQEEWSRDLWAPTQKNEVINRRRIVDLMREGYEEVARPLEPYVLVFLLFGVPAVVMATDFCRNHSNAEAGGYTTNHEITYGTCDVICELALSFRSLASVVVFFWRRENRVALISVRTLCRRFASRARRGFRHAPPPRLVNRVRGGADIAGGTSRRRAVGFDAGEPEHIPMLQTHSLSSDSNGENDSILHLQPTEGALPAPPPSHHLYE